LLEREIVPLFYDRNEAGVPVGWTDTMKANWRSLGPYVTAARMVRDYTTLLYEPAAASSRAALAEDGAVAKDLAGWKQWVRNHWPLVKVLDIEVDTSAAHEGDVRRVRAHVDVDGLQVGTLAVQALHGPIDSEGQFIGTPQVEALRHVGDDVWEADYTVGEAGPYGVTVRALPWHPHLVNQVEMGTIAWAH